MVPTAEAESPPVRRAPAWVRSVPSNSFAFVMATGIVSIGLHLAGFALLSTIWFLIAAVGLVVCGVAVPWRWWAVTGSLRTDLTTAGSSFGLLTLVAGTAVLGTRAALTGATVLPSILLGLALALWMMLGYLVPWMVLRAGAGRDLTRSVDGSWFLWTVASQSISILAATLHGHVDGTAADLLAIIAVLNWGIGLGLYLVIGTSLVIRVLRHGLTAIELTPAYWIVMGAVAISILAGSKLVGFSGSELSDAVQPLAAAAVPVLWTFATWMIPPLLVLGWWRHGLQGVPFRYGTALWAMVFPLGMYAASSMTLGQADGISVISWVGHTFLWAGVGAWLVVATAGTVQAISWLRAETGRKSLSAVGATEQTLS